MDDADIIRLAREIDELTDSKFRDTNMTELRERIRVRLGELAGKAKTMATTGWTDDEPGLVGDLKTFFTTDTPEPPSKRSEEHTSELQSHSDLVCRLLLEKKNT